MLWTWRCEQGRITTGASMAAAPLLSTRTPGPEPESAKTVSREVAPEFQQIHRFLKTVMAPALVRALLSEDAFSRVDAKGKPV